MLGVDKGGGHALLPTKGILIQIMELILLEKCFIKNVQSFNNQIEEYCTLLQLVICSNTLYGLHPHPFASINFVHIWHLMCIAHCHSWHEVDPSPSSLQRSSAPILFQPQRKAHLTYHCLRARSRRCLNLQPNLNQATALN